MLKQIRSLGSVGVVIAAAAGCGANAAGAAPDAGMTASGPSESSAGAAAGAGAGSFGTGAMPSRPSVSATASSGPGSPASNGPSATCTNFMVQDVLIDGGWYWNIHPLYSSNVIVRNLTVNSNNGSSNGDGVNPDSSTNVLIENVEFDTSDDMIALKSGTNEPGFYIGRPAHDIVAHNVVVRGGHGFSIGSELSGGVDNVYLYNDTQQTWSGVSYLFRVKTPPGRGDVLVGNLWFEDVSGAGSSNDVYVTTKYGSATIPGSNALGTPTFQNINIKNVQGRGSSSCTTPLASKEGSTLAQNDGC